MSGWWNTNNQNTNGIPIPASSTQLSTWHCPHLLLSTVLRRCCCWAPAAVDRYLLPAWRSATNCTPLLRSSDGTNDHYIDRALHTMWAVPVILWPFQDCCPLGRWNIFPAVPVTHPLGISVPITAYLIPLYGHDGWAAVAEIWVAVSCMSCIKGFCGSETWIMLILQ